MRLSKQRPEESFSSQKSDPSDPSHLTSLPLEPDSTCTADSSSCTEFSPSQTETKESHPQKAPSPKTSCTVYILRCSDGSLYTGWTNNLSARLHAHQSGSGAKYTRSRLPVELVYTENCSTRSEALRREAAIKRLSRAEKLTLIETQKNRASSE